MEINSNRLRQKKKLGQVFLKHEDMMARIFSSAGVTPDDTVVEIGAGDGRLSELIRKQAKKLIMVEIDQGFQEVLAERFSDCTNTHLVCGDILAESTLDEIRKHLGGTRAVVYGSIPYYITTPIMKWVLQNRKYFTKASLLMQKEVARRVVAGKGSKEYGFLSVIMQLAAEVSLGPVVGKKQFKPVPKVDSQVLHISLEDSEKSELEDSFVRLASTVFQQRRKQLTNTVSSYMSRKLTDEEKASLLGKGYDLRKRPEDLSPDELVGLFQALKQL